MNHMSLYMLSPNRQLHTQIITSQIITTQIIAVQIIAAQIIVSRQYRQLYNTATGQ